MIGDELGRPLIGGEPDDAAAHRPRKAHRCNPIWKCFSATGKPAPITSARSVVSLIPKKAARRPFVALRGPASRPSPRASRGGRTFPVAQRGLAHHSCRCEPAPL